MAGEQLFINRPLPGAQINHAHPLAKGLVGCWLMNEQAGIRCIDSSPYGNHGTMVGFGVPANLRSAQGIKFDGVDDYVDAGNGASLDFGTGSFTVEAWMIFNSLPIDGANHGGIGGATLVPGWNLFLVNNLLRFYLRDAGNFASGDYGYSNLLTNRWYHIVGVRNGTNLYLYVDSIQRGTTSGSTANVTNSDALTFGRAASSWFNGTIDEVRIYNRALNKDEIKELYLNPYAMFKR